MDLQARRFCQLAAAMLALATLLGALGTHALRPRLTPEHYEVLQTALHYQYFHSLGLLGLGLLVDRVPVNKLRIAGWLLFGGIVLFSGSLYLILAGAPRVVGVLTPIGGLALIVAWCLAAVALASAKLEKTH
jgi:uncharacterized membrane protein YgdD (TMEM256/DUF423 family)